MDPLSAWSRQPGQRYPGNGCDSEAPSLPRSSGGPAMLVTAYLAFVVLLASWGWSCQRCQATASPLEGPAAIPLFFSFNWTSIRSTSWPWQLTLAAGPLPLQTVSALPLPGGCTNCHPLRLWPCLPPSSLDWWLPPLVDWLGRKKSCVLFSLTYSLCCQTLPRLLCAAGGPSARWAIYSPALLSLRGLVYP